MKGKKFFQLTGLAVLMLVLSFPVSVLGYGGGGGSGGGSGGGGGGGGETSLGPDWSNPSGGGFGTAAGTIDLNNLPDPRALTPQERREYDMRIAHTRSSMFDFVSGAGQLAQVSVAFTPLGLKIKVAIAAGSAAGQASSGTSAVGSGTLAGGLEALTRNMNPIGGIIVSEVVTRTVDHALKNGAKAPTQNIGTSEMESRRVDTGARTGMSSSGHDVFR